MDIICPSCKTKMDALTIPQGEARRHYRCPLCEGEYLIPAPGGVVETPGEKPAPAAEQPSSPPTIPGFTVGGVPGAEWQVPEELQFSLRVLEGAEAGKVFAVNRSRVTVGREEGDILLGDPLVSRKHAAFEVFGSHHIVVKDLASTNGTYLNGRLIAYSKLNNGDKIKIGSSVLEAVIQIAE